MIHFSNLSMLSLWKPYLSLSTSRCLSLPLFPLEPFEELIIIPFLSLSLSLIVFAVLCAILNRIFSRAPQNVQN